jgi:hypothetical protein
MAYSLGTVKPWVQAAADEVGPMFGYKSIGGYRRVGSVPDSDHPKGLALDFMTLSKTKGDQTVAYLIQNADRLGITYIIYWNRIWQNGQWSTYIGPNPHIDHVHVSFKANGGDGTTAVGNPASGGGLLDASSWPVVKQIEGIAATIQSRELWVRIGLYGLGFLLIVAGLLFLLRKPAEQIGTTAAKAVIGSKTKGAVQ